jgi:excisionase family DNA binding protein
MDKNNAIEKWSTLKEIQEHLGVGRETVLNWISTRNMPAYKVGRLWKFKISEVDDWIRSGGSESRKETKGKSES